MGGEPSLNDYKEGFTNFRNYIKEKNGQIFPNISGGVIQQPQPSYQSSYAIYSEHKGYFVQHKKFEEFENYINNFKSSDPSNSEMELKNKINSQKLETINIKEVIDRLTGENNNDNDSFIIINKKLCKLICKNDNNEIKYQITPSYLILQPNEYSNILIKNDDKTNIVNKSKLEVPNNSIFDFKNKMKMADKMYNDIINYYNNEFDIFNKLINKRSPEFQGFLVDQDWIKEWKNISNYDSNIKKIHDNINYDERTIKNSIQKQQDKNNLNYDNINIKENENKNYIVKDLNNLQTFLDSGKSYSLLNKKFLDSFASNLNYDSYKIEISNQTIIISDQNRKCTIQTGKNIINKNNNIKFENQPKKEIPQTQTQTQTSNDAEDVKILEHLIRLPLFKKELKTSNKLNQEDKYSIFLIKRAVIGKFIAEYDLRHIINFLDSNNKLTKDINYNNYDKIYPEIFGFLNEKKPDYIKKIKQFKIPEELKFKKNEGTITQKELFGLPKIKYFDDFEIIDQKFGLFLKDIFKNDLELLESKCLATNNKIFLEINYEPNKTNYQIVSISDVGNSIKVEYLVDIEPNNISFDENSILNSIIKIYNDKKGENLHENIFPLENKINLIFYSTSTIENNQELAKESSHFKKEDNTNINHLQNNINNINLMSQRIADPNNNNHPQKIMINGNNNFRNSLRQSESKLGGKEMKMQTADISTKKFYLMSEQLSRLLATYLNADNNNSWLCQSTNNLNFVYKSIIVNFEHYKIKLLSFMRDNKQFYYPSNFVIIDDSKRNFILSKFNNQYLNNLFIEICYILINNRSIAFITNGNNNNLIYFFHIKESVGIQTMELFAIFDCLDINTRNNLFVNLANDQNKAILINNPKSFDKEKLIKFHLINDVIKKDNEDNKINSAKKIPKFNTQPNAMNIKTAVGQHPNYKNLIPQDNIEICERLKVMILVALSQQFPVQTKLIKAYLINPQWLEEYQYNKIKIFVLQKNNEIRKIWKPSYDLNNLSVILPILDRAKLKEYNSQMLVEAKSPLSISFTQIQIHGGYIDCPESFILVNDIIFGLLKKYFKITHLVDEFLYINKKEEGDFIIMKDHQIYSQQNKINFQNSIFNAVINKDSNKYEIKYIFNYINKNILESELKIFVNYNIQNYISSRTCISSYNTNDYTSPIIINNDIIGNYYRYKKGFNYSQIINYSNILENNQLWTIIYLYINEKSIQTQLTGLNYIDKDFYLVKRKLIFDIKQGNNYSIFKKYFEGRLNQSKPGKKEILSIIKSYPQNDINELANNLSNINIPTNSPGSYKIEIISIKDPYNSNESYNILKDKDFELVENYLANEYLKTNKFPCYAMKCSFVGDNMIAFHYQVNKFGNKKYLIVLSSIDENNEFNNEYLLIYNQPNYATGHFNKIRNNINNFISSLRFVKKCAPIVVNEYMEIGKVLKLIDYDDEYFPPIQIEFLKITDSKEDFDLKPPIGLENIGATCYMNATLQCICNIQKIVEFFKYNKHLYKIVEDDSNKEKLCSAFKLLIEKLYPWQISKNAKNYLNYLQQNNSPANATKFKKLYKKVKNFKIKSFAPNNFKETISAMNPLFEGIAANDAKDLVNFLIMTLHNELNKAPPEQINNFGNLLQDQTNKQLMFNNFIDNFAKTHKSIISDIFYGVNCNITQCGNCQTMSYNYQIYFFLIFPLEEVRKFVIMNNGGFNNNFNTNTVDIYNCFDFDKKINNMVGDNAMYCNYCKQTCGSSMCTFLTTGPEVLIIILNRGKGIEFNVKINFYLELNLSNYIEYRNTGCQYELFGVITHIGESGMGGHFIAYCKSYWDNNWYKFNDAIVTPVSNFKSEVIDFAMPYLLFYQKKNYN